LHRRTLQLGGKFASDEPITEWFGGQQEPPEDIPRVFATTNSHVTEWTSPRDLAILPPPNKVALADGNFLEFFSVIPSFGEDGNFIAFLTTLDTDLHLLQNHTFFLLWTQ